MFHLLLGSQTNLFLCCHGPSSAEVHRQGQGWPHDANWHQLPTDPEEAPREWFDVPADLEAHPAHWARSEKDPSQELSNQMAEKKSQIAANETIAHASEGTLCPPSGQERFLSLGSSHLSQFCKAALHGCTTSNEELTAISHNGNLNLQACCGSQGNQNPFQKHVHRRLAMGHHCVPSGRNLPRFATAGPSSFEFLPWDCPETNRDWDYGIHGQQLCPHQGLEEGIAACREHQTQVHALYCCRPLCPEI